MKYIVVVGCAEDDVQFLRGGTDSLEVAIQEAKEVFRSGAKFWNTNQSHNVLITKAFVYELVAEAIVNVDVQVIGKSEAVPA